MKPGNLVLVNSSEGLEWYTFIGYFGDSKKMANISLNGRHFVCKTRSIVASVKTKTC